MTETTLDPFDPPNYLPVRIDVRNAVNPYEMGQDVTYHRGNVTVFMEKGFQWDGASIPPWWPVLPWVLTILSMHYVPPELERALWFVTAVLVAYTIRLLPYMQKMGLHARGAAVHDKLYRAQETSRLIADGILDEIMEADGVPWDVRTIIYRRLRHFGWWAWWRNKRNKPARAEAAKDVDVKR